MCSDCVGRQDKLSWEIHTCLDSTRHSTESQETIAQRTLFLYSSISFVLLEHWEFGPRFAWLQICRLSFDSVTFNSQRHDTEKMSTRTFRHDNMLEKSERFLFQRSTFLQYSCLVTRILRATRRQEILLCLRTAKSKTMLLQVSIRRAP